MPFNSIFSWIIKKRIHQIELFKKHPHEVQNEVLLFLIQHAIKTEWGVKHRFKNIKNYTDFKSELPLTNYESIKPYIDRLLKGEQNVFWGSDVKWFAKSSGTVGDKSKFIPVTKDSLYDCHYRGGKDLLSLYYNQFPDTKLYKGKHLMLGGNAEINYLNTDSYFGDLSAILLKNMPWWAELRRTPSKEIALMREWEKKIEKLAESTIEQDVCILAGVPSWTLVLCNRILEITGKKHLREVWPNLELFMHGGVSFKPYRDEFKRLIPFDDMNYLETYNASEGFFGIQNDLSKSDLLLMLDYGIFYEFIPMDDFNGIDSKVVKSIAEIEIGVNYALVISTNGGLWRYIIGDTIKFTSKLPYRFKITGRTKSFINAFGEELIVENAEAAIKMACDATNARVSEFTAAPVFMENKSQGKHEWLIEFSRVPQSIEAFTLQLDKSLQSLNSDYEAKRMGDLSLGVPIVHSIKKGVFDDWLKKKRKMGGQNKIPRLMNNRTILEEILAEI